MKVVTCTKVGNLKDSDPQKRGVIEVVDVPLRKIGDDELLIKVAYCAICGSDPHVVEGIFGWEPPFGLGHELSGVVVEVGKNARKNGFKVGDRVAGNFRRYCGTCYYCKNAMEQFCEYATEEPEWLNTLFGMKNSQLSSLMMYPSKTDVSLSLFLLPFASWIKPI